MKKKVNAKSGSITWVTLLLGCLIGSMLIGFFMSRYYAKNQYLVLSDIAEKLITEYPEREQEIIQSIKNSKTTLTRNGTGTDYLTDYGFTPHDFGEPYMQLSIVYAAIGILSLFVFLAVFHFMLNQKRKRRLKDITGYLEKINLGREVSILPEVEDDFSPLQDEIYKTVTELRIAKETALRERKNFADHLANIAHQIKTPVTSISVLSQLGIKELDREGIRHIKKQSDRLTLLVDALLTLSRIDAGVLELKRVRVDVHCLLELSIEAMEDRIREKGIKVILPNHTGVFFMGDRDWSMEALINIINNCTEHMPKGGTLEFDYMENPLYTEIMVKDNGVGFSKQELPHIFERFYQGEKSLKTGVGIGLSLSKSIFEMQNGFISAKNQPEGGVCFSIRFYSH